MRKRFLPNLSINGKIIFVVVALYQNKRQKQKLTDIDKKHYINYNSICNYKRNKIGE